MKLSFIILALLATALLFAGCASTSPQETGKTAPATQGKEAPAKNGGQQAQPSTPAQGSGSSAADELAKFFGLKSAKSYQVEYSYETNAPVGQPASAKLKLFMKDEQNFRTDLIFGEYESRTYVNGKDMFACSQTGANWMCQKLPPQEPSTTAHSDKFEQDFLADKTKFNVELLPPRNIAGATAACFKSTSGDTIGEYCFSAEGVPLYTKFGSTSSKPGEQNTITAISYKLSVSDSDLALPAQPGSGVPSGVSGTPSGGAGGADVCSYCQMLSGQDKADCLANC